jgi:hypothetical protein
MPKDYTETNTALAVLNGLSVADSQVTITPDPDGGSWCIDERPPTVRRNGRKLVLQMFRISPLPEDRSDEIDPPRSDDYYMIQHVDGGISGDPESPDWLAGHVSVVNGVVAFSDVPVDGHTLESAIDHLLLCVYRDPKNPQARVRTLDEGTSPTGSSPM